MFWNQLHSEKRSIGPMFRSSFDNVRIDALRSRLTLIHPDGSSRSLE